MPKKNKNIIIIDENKVIPIHKCYWLNQKGEPCPWNALAYDKDYCKRHSVYEGVYKKEDIPSLIKCSGCKNMFKPNEEIKSKQCDSCHTRCEIIRNKEKQEKVLTIKICKGLTQKGTNCTFEANELDDYCEKHQSYKKWKNLIDLGKNVCKNWIRGCFEIIDHDKKSCTKCRNKEQIAENANNQTKKEKAIEFNKINTDNKMCLECNALELTVNIRNNKCTKCYDNYKRSMEASGFPVPENNSHTVYRANMGLPAGVTEQDSRNDATARRQPAAVSLWNLWGYWRK